MIEMIYVGKDTYGGVLKQHEIYSVNFKRTKLLTAKTFIPIHYDGVRMTIMNSEGKLSTITMSMYRFVKDWYPVFNDNEYYNIKRKVVTICSSTKFKDECMAAASGLEEKGFIVFGLNTFSHSEGRELTEDEMKLHVDIHNQKIMMSDAIFVVDVDNYIGRSVRSEITFAIEHRKEVYYLSDCPEYEIGDWRKCK